MMHSLSERGSTIDTKKYPRTNRGQAAIRPSFGEAESGPVRGQRWGVILAGGDGTRLRALTRRITGDETPKQFCALLGRESLLDQTRRRVALAIPKEQTLMVLTRKHERFYSTQLSDVSAERLLVQPSNQGTAPAILHAVLHLAREYPEDAVAFFPSDHYFSDEESLMAHIKDAFEIVAQHPETIVLLGITPTEPETGYGWIEPGSPVPGQSHRVVNRVRRFWEKPHPALAQSLLERGCLWNSFLMVGRVSAFLEMIRRAVPDLYEPFAAAQTSLGTEGREAALSSLYQSIPSINFSEEVLARLHDSLAVLRVSEVGWSDWGEPERVLATLAGLGVRIQRAASGS